MKAPVPQIPAFNGFTIKPKPVNDPHNSEIIWDILPNRAYKVSAEIPANQEVIEESSLNYLKREVVFAVSGIFFMVQFLVLFLLYKFNFFEISNQLLDSQKNHLRAVSKVNILDQKVNEVSTHLKIIEKKVEQVQSDQQLMLLEWKNLQAIEQSEPVEKTPSVDLPTPTAELNLAPIIELQKTEAEEKTNSDIIKYNEIKNIL